MKVKLQEQKVKVQRSELRKSKDLRIVAQIEASKVGMVSDRKYSYNEYQEAPFEEDSPEVKLLTALLARAIMDLGPTAPKKERRDALVWFTGQKPRKDTITFSLVIEELQLSSKMIRFIEEAIKDAEIIEDITREIENAEENQYLPEGKARGASISKLVKRAWRSECEKNGAIFRQKRWPFGRGSYRRVA